MCIRDRQILMVLGAQGAQGAQTMNCTKALLLAWYLHVCKRTCDFSHLFAYHQTDSLLLQARRLERIVDPLHRVSLSDCHPQPNLGSLRALLS